MRYKKQVFVSVFLVLVIAVINRAAAQSKPNTGRQIDVLEKEKKLRTPTEQKIDAQLLQAIREKKGKKMPAGVNLEPVNVHADSKGNLNVDINAEVTDALISKIKAMGGSIIYPSKQYHTIKAAINLSMVEKIAGFQEVKFIGPSAVPQLNRPVRPLTGTDMRGTDPPATVPSAPQK